ncbi:MAG TPA: nitroreductase family protein [Phototrophicaceae bacterium]|nr:nitroreductase family protein [Phototrophicaceae bacterium]
MALTPVLQRLRQRRSIRRYRPEPVPRALIEKVLEAAIWAPSAHNRQPWRLVVIEDAAQHVKLAEAMNARLREDLRADGVADETIEAQAARRYERLTAAPVLVVLCLTMADMSVYPDERRNQCEYVMAVQSAALAGQNLLLAAQEVGLGACWICAPLFCPEIVREVLALPDDWQAQALFTIGYPAETPEKDRRPLEEVVLWR